MVSSILANVIRNFHVLILLKQVQFIEYPPLCGIGELNSERFLCCTGTTSKQCVSNELHVILFFYIIVNCSLCVQQ